MTFVKKHTGLISFILVFLFLTISFAIIGIKPFGNRFILLGDSYEQYVPFFSLFRDKTLGLGSMDSVHDLFYSWKVGLGTNYLLLFFYYLASPFNLLLLFVSKSGIVGALTIIIILKIALSAASFSYYLSKKESFSMSWLVSIALAMGYSLSGFVCGYFWNIMWLDSLIMFPIVLLGLEKLLKGEKPFMYIVSLCLTIYLNFYMAFMICIFLVIYALLWKYSSVKEFGRRICTFGLSSLLAAGMTALSLFVTYFGIAGTETAGFAAPSFGFFGNIFNVFKHAFYLTKPVVTERYNGVANIYCGSAMILLALVYFVSSGISRYDKVRHGAMLLILIISMNEKVLNYIWHGFHEQFLIPNRFSFIYIFLILSMGYDANGSKDRQKGVSIARICLGGSLAILFPCLCFFFVDLDAQINSTTVILINIVFLIIYSVIFVAGLFRKKYFGKIMAILSVLFIAEIFSNAFVCYEDCAYNVDETDIEAMTEFADMYHENEPADFCRTEILNPAITNEATYQGLNPASTFCSTIYGDSVLTMMDMGYSYMNNEFIYQGYTPFTSSILGVKYHFYTVDHQVYAEENPVTQSIGFTAKSDILSYKPEEEISPSANVNSMARLMTGIDSDIMQDVSDKVIYDNIYCDIKESVSKTNSVLITPNSSEAAVFAMEYETEESGIYYIYLAATDTDNVSILLDGSIYIEGKITNGWLALPELDKGVIIDIYFETDTETSLVWYFSRYNAETVQAVLEQLKENNMQVTSYSEGALDAVADVKAGDMLITSIPYDKGWKVYEGGERIDTVPVLRGLTGIELSEGTHNLRFEYTPQGFTLGLVITIISWVIFILIVVSRNRIWGKKEAIISEVTDGE